MSATAAAPPTGALPGVRDTPRGAGTIGQTRAGFGLLTPFLVLYLAFLIGPALYGLLMSFFDGSSVRSGLGPFAGFGNYTEALTSSDFWSSMWHTVLFTLLTTPPLVLVALALAMLTDRIRRGRWFFRLVFFAPYVMPVTCVGLVFTWMYVPQTGLFATWLDALGLPAPAWLADPNWAMIAVALMTVWWTIGFNFVLYLAGLQDIPRELYEAAAVDGAGPGAQWRRITVPLLSRTTALVTMLQTIASLKVFDQIYLLTVGGPNYSTRPVIEYIYDVGFTDFRTGYGAAASMLYFVVILAVSAVWFAISRRRA
ncbi:sugar ABC transporter permease [Actinocatenispora thailandica]|uniref:Sugar ABC transporter permease n=1 Tax=Actinocatenispora thailandica TaxID=227318 RepID=A0A7R7DMM0_9ACTN|nr:sugar ABC transporter permease [Actinocatenispora thailandica]BCJ34377.1 sugar ABC transporter permease [Actinocatenispora thailandica]